MAYTPHDWKVNEAITRQRMNAIEDELGRTSGRSDTNETNITEINNKIGGSFNSSNTIASALSNISQQVSSLSSLSSSVTSLDQRVSELRTEMDGSHGSNLNTSYESTISRRYDTLLEHLKDLDGYANQVMAVVGPSRDLNTVITSLATNIGRINDELVTVIHPETGSLTVLNQQIYNATTANGYNTLDERLDAMDSTDTSNLAAAKAYTDAQVGALGTAPSAVDYVEDRLGFSGDTSTTAKSYADGIKTAVDTEIGDLGTSTTVAGYVNSRVGTSESAKSYTDSKISEVNTAIDGVDNAVDALADRVSVNETAISGHDTSISGLDGRISAIETSGAAAADLTALEERVDDIEDEIDDAHVQNLPNDEVDTLAKRFGRIESRLTTIEETPAQTGGSSTVIIPVDRITYDNGTGLPTIYTDSEKQTTVEPSADVDYLLEGTDEKYYYWKYINDAWELISGGGASGGGEPSGGGTSSASILATLPTTENADPNIDYYIGNNENGYTHYRYIPSEQDGEDGIFVRILPNSLINRVGVGTITVITNDDNPEAVLTTQMSGGIQAYSLGDNETNLLSNFTALRSARLKRTYEEDGITLKKQELIFTDTNGVDQTAIEIKGGGGGGAAYTVRLTNPTPSTSFSIPNTGETVVNIGAKPIVNYGNTLAEGVEISGEVTYKLSTDNTWKTANVTIPTITNNVPFEVNVASILGAVGTTTQIRLRITTQPDGEEGETFTQAITFSISKVNMSIESIGFSQSTIHTGNSFVFSYRCIGLDLEKIVTFKIDGNVAKTVDVGTSHNERQDETISLTELTTGMHSLQVYFTANGINSNILNYYLIINKDAEREAPLVGLAAEKESINYGDELKVNYTVYTAGQETTDEVDIEVYTMENGTKVVQATATLTDVPNSTVQPYTIVNYPEKNENYTLYISLTARKNGETVLSQTETTSLTVKPFTSEYRLQYAGTNNILYSYSAYGRTNNDADKEVHSYNYTAHDSNSTELTFSSNFNNFNWATNGYVDGQTLTISGGATVNINVPILSSTYQGTSLETNTAQYTDITQNGRTIEIEYEVQSATDLNDVIIDCMDNNTHVGFQVTPQSCYLLNSTNATNFRQDSTGFIFNEENLAAAYLNTDTRMHLVFVIEPWADHKASDGNYHQSANIYINGEFANAAPYERGETSTVDSFTTNSTIRIGSASCIIKLYSVKLYNRGLTYTEVLQNYKMAPANIMDKIARFEDNDILNNAGLVDYEKARKKYTCLLLVGDDANIAVNDQGVQYITNPVISPYKGSPSPIGRTKKGKIEKKTESGLLLTTADPSNLDVGYKVEFNLMDKLTDGGYASSNNVQGTSSQKYPIHNLKVYLMRGVAGTEVEQEDGSIYYGSSEKVKYCLNDRSPIGESTLCWKADYMSTDHANTYNANLAETLYNEALEAKQADNKVQNTIHGVRCLLFQQQGSTAPVFVSDGCLNNDKGNNKAFGLEYSNKNDPTQDDFNNDTLRQKWEFTNNSDELGFFKTDKLFQPIGSGTSTHLRAKDAFESTYPDEGDLGDAGYQPNYNHLQLLLSWVNQRARYLDTSIEIHNDTGEVDDEGNPIVETITVPMNISDTAGSGGTYNGVAYDTERQLKKAIFRNEFEQHFNLNHVLTYYIFCEFTAMCDNRVKNMFMRCDNIRNEQLYAFDSNNNSIEVLLDDEYEKSYDPDTQKVTRTLTATHVNVALQEAGIIDAEGNVDISKIDWDNSHFAIWAPVLYDLDSCYGAENVGYLRIRYDADWTYEYEGAPQFNGFDSIFWLMVADTFKDEIVTLARELYNKSEGLNYRTIYQQQIADAKMCPALTNQDMLIKFNAPWETGFMDYSLDNPAWTYKSYKYLQRGSRMAQKSSFVYRRANLLSSNYLTNTFLTDKITFRAGVPVSVANSGITLTANQILYPAVQYGDNKDFIRSATRIAAGDPCTISATSSINGNDGIAIAGGSILTDIGDISAFHPYQLEVGQGKNLKKLIIGSHEDGYTNTSLSEIQNLNQCILLEEINVENCTNLGSISLAANGLIKKIYTKGSHISSISLPNGGVLDTIEYSSYASSIIIQNQSYLRNFSYEDSDTNNYANLTTLRIENTPNVPIADMVIARLPNLSGGLRLIGINLDIDDTLSIEDQQALSDKHIALLEMLTTSDYALGKYLGNAGGRDDSQYPYITGDIYVFSIRQSLLTKCNELYPNLTVHTEATIAEHAITYKNVDANGNKTTLITLYRTAGEAIPEPVLDTDPITGKYYIQDAPVAQIAYDGTQWVPVRAADAQYIYRFGTYNNAGRYQRYSGWEIEGNSGANLAATTIGGPITILAKYPPASNILQQYTVTWYDYDRRTPLASISNIDYGTDGSILSAPSRDNGTLVTKKEVNGSYKVFTGWDKPLTKIVGDIDVYSQWDSFDSGLSTTEGISDLNDLSYAAWYYLTKVNAGSRETLLDNHVGSSLFNIQLGHDFNYDDYITTYNLLDSLEEGTDELYLDGTDTSLVKIYDGTAAHESHSIYPLADLSQDFTLALDFKFLLDDDIWQGGNIGEYVLASCFQSSGATTNGFKVSLVNDNAVKPSIQVTWGTNSVIIDYAKIGTNPYDNSQTTYYTYRNMIVLRHIGSEEKRNSLYVYYSTPSDDPSYYNNNGVTYHELQWGSSTPITNPLILGGNFTGSSTNIENSSTRKFAKGIIYYAKYWAADIGNGNCEDLAIWPHESVSYKVMGYVNDVSESSADYALRITNEDRTIKINFLPAQVIGDRYYNFNQTSSDGFNEVLINNKYLSGWGSSKVRDFCNDRIYRALPIGYQSLIERATITSNGTVSSKQGGMLESTVYTTEDFIYLPSYREVEPTVSDTLLKREAIRYWSWVDSGSINNLYTLSSGRLVKESAANVNYLRIQFFNVPIKPTAKIFHFPSTQNPANSTWYYTNAAEGATNVPVTVQPGDIWYDSTTEIAYIFVTTQEINQGAIVDPVQSRNVTRGGWMPASIWALRTYYTDTYVYAYSRYFYKVLRGGQVDEATNSNDYVPRALLPEFSI